jgi:hypothetical protein
MTLLDKSDSICSPDVKVVASVSYQSIAQSVNTKKKLVYETLFSKKLHFKKKK